MPKYYHRLLKYNLRIAEIPKRVWKVGFEAADERCHWVVALSGGSLSLASSISTQLLLLLPGTSRLSEASRPTELTSISVPKVVTARPSNLAIHTANEPVTGSHPSLALSRKGREGIGRVPSHRAHSRSIREPLHLDKCNSRSSQAGPRSAEDVFFFR